MPAAYRRLRDHRFSSLATFIAALLVFTPVFAAAVECGEERFISGSHRLPSHGEAMAQCREQEASMTHPQTGTHKPLRSCHDLAPPGEHGRWRYGRVGAEVTSRENGDSYAFEGLWMCKPLAEERSGSASSLQ